MKKLISILLLVIVSIFIVGCSSKSIKQNSIVNNLSQLKPSPLNENTLYYLKSGVNFKNYNIIKVPTIEITYENKSLENKRLTNLISIYFTNKLSLELNSIFNNNQGNQQLELEASIISLDVSFDDLKFYNFLPYSLAFKALKRGTGIEKRKLRVHLALKLIDIKSKDIIAQLITKNIKESSLTIEEISFSDVKPILDKWVALYKLRLQELNEDKYNLQ